MTPVEWDDGAYDLLADLWVQATPAERDEVEAAFRRIEATVGSAAGTAGESRTGRDRILFDPPLAVIYRAPTPTLGTPAVIFRVGWSRRRPKP